MIKTTKTNKTNLKRKLGKIFTPIRLIMLSFLAVILVGAILLLLPISTVKGHISFTDAVFIATSATCVTGLSVCVVAEEFTVFGQVVIMLLAQIGGLGFMTLTSALYLIFGHKVSLRKRLSMQEEFSSDGMSGLKRLAFAVVKLTAISETLGGILLTIAFSRYYAAGKAVWYGMFHSVMAFCNAGFDIVSHNGTSYEMFQSDPFILIVTMVLIVVGGIGFMAIADLVHVRKWRKLKLHTRIVFPITLALILFGAIGFFAAEFNNPDTIGNMSVGDKILNAFFQSITARTAGFSSINQEKLTGFSQILTIILMFIGVCPGSTGGGIKATTLFVLLVTVYATLRRKKEVIISRYSIGRETISKAATILMLAIGVASISIMALAIACGDSFSVEQLMFEQVSAYATVGLSRGITPYLNEFSKWIITINMYIGRIGSLGFFMAFVSPVKTNSGVRYPEAGILL